MGALDGPIANPDDSGRTSSQVNSAASQCDHACESGRVEVADVARILLVALAAAMVWFRVWEPVSSFSVIGVGATLAGGYPIFREAVENIVQRRMTMELSMTIALVAALAIGEAFTALVITLFVLVAEVLEGLTVDRGRKAIEELLALLPSTATVIHDGEQREVALNELAVGEVILVRPGGRIPADGTVVDGISFVDQSNITGESLPVEKVRGSDVYAGTINQSGALDVRADRLGADTTFGEIIEAVERAEHSRAPIQKTADRLAGYLVYFALAAALVTFLVTRNVRSTISVIIVAGACGIAAGTPLAILGGIGRAARIGSIIKGGLYLERLGIVDTETVSLPRRRIQLSDLGNNLAKFVQTLRIARDCRRIIWQNFYGTLVVDAVGIVLAAMGVLNPLAAAFVHVASELTFIMNSARLLQVPRN